MTGRELAGPGSLEPELWAKLRFISDPVCATCGEPFEIAVEEGQLCGACLARPPAYTRARAALEYGEVSRDLVLGLKYQGRRDGLDLLGGWMALAAAELVTDEHLIVPVPLHYFRLLRRGFNQSAWLAGSLTRLTGARLGMDVLRRTRSTPIQGGLSAEGRRRNVRGVFRVRRSRQHMVKDQKILLVDDVLTTGATAEACSRALKRAGGKLRRCGHPGASCGPARGAHIVFGTIPGCIACLFAPVVWQLFSFSGGDWLGTTRYGACR